MQRELNRLTILHIDDDPLDARLMRENLLSGINDVDLIHINKPASDIGYYKRFDGILLDYMLKASMTGMDLAATIKSNYPEIPVIIVTGMDQSDPQIGNIRAHGLFIMFKSHPLEMKRVFRNLIADNWKKPEKDRRSQARS